MTPQKFKNFPDLFRKATGGAAPFPYQERFAADDELHELIHVPTGAGKTAAVVLGWLWRRCYAGKPTPRRLVYCLPTRVLVEQTHDAVKTWLKNLGHGEIKAHVLMGGEGGEEWDLHPEATAVLIGTQDMLLSRALNRGYGMSRYRWPMHFGLLNNDALWVLDEIQLMGTGLATSTQLQAFRESFQTYGTSKTVWMSATLLPEWLASVDYRGRIEPEPKLKRLELGREDYENQELSRRWNAGKPIEAANLSVDDTEAVAEFVVKAHQKGSLTLVVVNTVGRCHALYGAIRGRYHPPGARGRGKAVKASEPAAAPDVRLIHSRFRPRERKAWRTWLAQNEKEMREGNPLGRIVVATQVIEAGVDLSARTLVTELAPWASLVQRFGRCNRRGEFRKSDPARVYWIDAPEKRAAPYPPGELDTARKQIKTLADVGLKSLDAFFRGLGESERSTLFPFDPPHVVRRKDFVDLFDTTPDLAGNDIDVSRFIREGDGHDVQVFWRNAAPPKGPLAAADARRLSAFRDELCPVNADGFRSFLGSHAAYHWDALSCEWLKADAADVYPGRVYWVETGEGGYDAESGWSPGRPWPDDLWIHDPVADGVADTTEEPGYDTDLASAYQWRSIAEHTDDVLQSLRAILQKADGRRVAP